MGYMKRGSRWVTQLDYPAGTLRGGAPPELTRSIHVESSAF